MRRSVVVAALALAAQFAVPAPAPAASCAAADSTTVRSNSYVRIYEVPDGEDRRLYACRRRTGRRWLLTRSFDDGYVTSGTYDTVRLTGRFAGWVSYETDISCKADCPPGYDPTSSRIVVVNLATRRTVREIGTAVAAGALVLTRTGAVAWVRVRSSATYVYGADRDGRRTLDRGDVDADSLRRDGMQVSWVRGGLRRYATLR